MEIVPLTNWHVRNTMVLLEMRKNDYFTFYFLFFFLNKPRQLWMRFFPRLELLGHNLPL